MLYVFQVKTFAKLRCSERLAVKKQVNWRLENNLPRGKFLVSYNSVDIHTPSNQPKLSKTQSNCFVPIRHP